MSEGGYHPTVDCDDIKKEMSYDAGKWVSGSFTNDSESCPIPRMSAGSEIYCTVCNVYFYSEVSLLSHLQSSNHQMNESICKRLKILGGEIFRFEDVISYPSVECEDSNKVDECVVDGSDREHPTGPLGGVDPTPELVETAAAAGNDHQSQNISADAPQEPLEESISQLCRSELEKMIQDRLDKQLDEMRKSVVNIQDPWEAYLRLCGDSSTQIPGKSKQQASSKADAIQDVGRISSAGELLQNDTLNRQQHFARISIEDVPLLSSGDNQKLNQPRPYQRISQLDSLRLDGKADFRPQLESRIPGDTRLADTRQTSLNAASQREKGKEKGTEVEDRADNARGQHQGDFNGGRVQVSSARPNNPIDMERSSSRNFSYKLPGDITPHHKDDLFANYLENEIDEGLQYLVNYRSSTKEKYKSDPSTRETGFLGSGDAFSPIRDVHQNSGKCDGNDRQTEYAQRRADFLNKLENDGHMGNFKPSSCREIILPESKYDGGNVVAPNQNLSRKNRSGLSNNFEKSDVGCKNLPCCGKRCSCSFHEKCGTHFESRPRDWNQNIPICRSELNESPIQHDRLNVHRNPCEKCCIERQKKCSRQCCSVDSDGSNDPVVSHRPLGFPQLAKDSCGSNMETKQTSCSGKQISCVPTSNAVQLPSFSDPGIGGGSLGMLLVKLAKCSIRTEYDAELAHHVSVVMIQSLMEHRTKTHPSIVKERAETTFHLINILNNIETACRQPNEVKTNILSSEQRKLLRILTEQSNRALNKAKAMPDKTTTPILPNAELSTDADGQNLERHCHSRRSLSPLRKSSPKLKQKLLTQLPLPTPKKTDTNYSSSAEKQHVCREAFDSPNSRVQKNRMEREFSSSNNAAGSRTFPDNQSDTSGMIDTLNATGRSSCRNDQTLPPHGPSVPGVANHNVSSFPLAPPLPGYGPAPHYGDSYLSDIFSNPAFLQMMQQHAYPSDRPT